MSTPLDLDQVKTFVAIVDTGSFTRAADEVFKTQSAVSMQMRKLEERLGVPLFERNGRNVRLTEDGYRLLTYARKILALSQETLSAFDEEAMAGHVRIGLPDDYAERFLPEILARFSRSNPLVELEIACEPSTYLADHVEKSQLDVALVSDCRDFSNVGEIVRREPLHFVTSAAHDVHHRTILPLALGRIDCAWRRKGCEALDAMGRKYRVLFSSWSAQIVTSAVLSGLAISVLPECALRPGMRVLGPHEGFPHLTPTEIGVLRARNAESPVVTALVDHIRESLQNMVPPASQQPQLQQMPDSSAVRLQRNGAAFATAGR
ncbi:LysR family transcriptional regulator [Consotaella aegiceratis]|uniref:LysR family transcriptional regulator n=1 Tax=Consotaella aegiceratis TaxID=3097961 RepID=UPI002F3E7527